MLLVFRELHRAAQPELLNEEWIIVENTAANLVNAAGCALAVARAKGNRPHPLGTLTPGFVLKPGEKIRLVTGSPSKKSQGEPPAEGGIRNYHLFLREPVLERAGQVLYLQLKQVDLARAVFAPDAPDGVQAE